MKSKIQAILKRQLIGSSPQDIKTIVEEIMEIIKPPKDKKIPFEQSAIYDKMLFKAAFPDWPKSKLKHYYESADAYSTEGNRYINWYKAIKNWADRDELKNIYTFTADSKDVSIKQEVANDFMKRA